MEYEYALSYAKNEIKKTLELTIKKLNYSCEINLEKPSEKLGDFSFPCFSLASILKKSPKLISTEITKNIEKNIWIEKVETIGGYVNFFLNKKLLNKKIIDSIFKKNKEYGFLLKKDKKVIIEHTSANPNGPLHVGRARNPIIGDTIVRLYKAAGYKVESQFYLDDMGKQVAILAWGVENLEYEDIPKSEYEKSDHKNVGFYQVANNQARRCIAALA